MAQQNHMSLSQDAEVKQAYTARSVTDDSMIEYRFYSNLMPVHEDAYDPTERGMIIRGELEMSAYDHGGIKFKAESPEGDSIIVSRITELSCHHFAADIKYHFGLKIPLLVTEEEASAVVSVAKLWQATMPAAGRNISAFLGLPPEIRQKVYEYAVCHGRWWITDEDGPTRRDFSRAMGDPSGFYFPFGKSAVLLTINRQIRQEVLPLAYRKTTFHLADVDDLTRLLLAVGRIGRENIECLEFLWESRIDLECNRRKFPDLKDKRLKLPSLHVSTCIQLLRQCTRLKLLRPRLESFVMAQLSKTLFDNDVGILSLCSISGIEKLQIMCFDEEVQEDRDVLQWLQDEAAKQQLLRPCTSGIEPEPMN